MVIAHPEAKLHANISPSRYSWIGTSSGIRGIGFNYSVIQDECGAEMYIDKGKGADEENKAIFDQLLAHKEDIEKSFGGPLSWERLEGRRACRIRHSVPGGYRSPEEEWPSIQAALVQGMVRLEKALRPYLKSLKLGA